jgi:hypothetical protein
MVRRRCLCTRESQPSRLCQQCNLNTVIELVQFNQPLWEGLQLDVDAVLVGSLQVAALVGQRRSASEECNSNHFRECIYPFPEVVQWYEIRRLS